MDHLAQVLPAVGYLRRLPVTRDEAMLLMAAINEIFLGVDTYLAHATSGMIRSYEWVPIFFGPIAGGLLLVAGVIARRWRPTASLIATVTLLASIGVGVLGAYFHFLRAAMPAGPEGSRLSMALLVWAPPVLAPLTFALVGVLGLSAAWKESPPDSGRLRLDGWRHLQLPYSKTRAYFFLVSLGAVVTLVSAVLDHGRADFSNPWLWLPSAAGLFAAVAAMMMGLISRPTRADALTFVGAMAALVVVGLIGAVLHIEESLGLGQTFIWERVLRGAPVMAPLLFANIAALGFLCLLEPDESGPGRS